MITIGIFIASCCNSVLLTYATGELQWKLAFGLQIIPALFLVVVISTLPFSPRWLLFQGTFNLVFFILVINNYLGRSEEAKQTLSKLRQLTETDTEFLREFDEISASVEADRRIGTARWSELLEPSVLLRVIIGGIVLIIILIFIGS